MLFVCLSVCLSACLSVSSITTKVTNQPISLKLARCRLLSDTWQSWYLCRSQDERPTRGLQRSVATWMPVSLDEAARDLFSSRGTRNSTTCATSESQVRLTASICRDVNAGLVRRSGSRLVQFPWYTKLYYMCNFRITGSPYCFDLSRSLQVIKWVWVGPNVSFDI